MARIRTVKPELFRHEGLFELEEQTGLPIRLAFIGLFTACDREGRFKWRPRQLKLDVAPYDNIDFEDILNNLLKEGIINKYEVYGEVYGEIPTFKTHQVINQREAKSTSPANCSETHVNAHASTYNIPSDACGVNVPPKIRALVFERDRNQCVRCQSTEDLTIDHIFPRSIGGTHAETNLRVLCRPCNSGRPVDGDGLLKDLSIDGLTMADMKRMCTHVHAHGEGKGKEGKRKGREEEGKGKEGDNTAHSRFEEFWSEYPNKTDKKKSSIKFLKLNPDENLFERIMAGLRAQKLWRDNAPEDEWVPEWRNPLTWLNGENWEDEIKPYKTQPDKPVTGMAALLELARSGEYHQ